MTDGYRYKDAGITRLRLAVVGLSRRMREESGADIPLTPSRYAALSTVGAQGPLRLTDLAQIERVSKSSITRIVTNLSEVGFVTLVADPSDGRSTLVGLTRAGEQLLTETSDRTEAFLAEQFATFSDAELLVLDAAVLLLERLAAPGDSRGRTSKRDSRRPRRRPEEPLAAG